MEKIQKSAADENFRFQTYFYSKNSTKMKKCNLKKLQKNPPPGWGISKDYFNGGFTPSSFVSILSTIFSTEVRLLVTCHIVRTPLI